MTFRRLVVGLIGALLLLAGAAAASLAGGLPAPVYRTVAVAAGGRIYVLGGHDRGGATISDVDVFDPASGVARRAGSLALPTHGAAAANLWAVASSSSAAPRARCTTSCSSSSPPAAARA